MSDGNDKSMDLVDNGVILFLKVTLKIGVHEFCLKGQLVLDLVKGIGVAKSHTKLLAEVKQLGLLLITSTAREVLDGVDH